MRLKRVVGTSHDPGTIKRNKFPVAGCVRCVNYIWNRRLPWQLVTMLTGTVTYTWVRNCTQAVMDVLLRPSAQI